MTNDQKNCNTNWNLKNVTNLWYKFSGRQLLPVGIHMVDKIRPKQERKKEKER